MLHVPFCLCLEMNIWGVGMRIGGDKESVECSRRFFSFSFSLCSYLSFSFSMYTYLSWDE